MNYIPKIFSLLRKMMYSALKAAWSLPIIINAARPLVTVFGGARAHREDEYSQQAYQLARLLAQEGMSVIGGGGPGIMEATSCGFSSVDPSITKGAITLGIGVSGIDDQYINRCSRVIKMPTFFARKWLLIDYADAFVVFPGGIGTMDEFFELLNLIKHNLVDRVPIFLVGKAYWQPLLTWYTDCAVAQGFIAREQLNAFKIEDDLELIRDTICRHYGLRKK